ncbi:MAG TPA: dihydrodipicolinate synthase family protein [Candidatus Blautia excrementipullorum]|nr:dihydrodipicolinate synthase family protein [Candidatus Blautia excrementipullorum]
MKKEKLKGIIPPLVTPLDREGKIDEQSLGKLIRFCINGGVSGIFILGSCGEGSSLTAVQKRAAVSAALKAAGGEVPVLVGVLETSTEKILEEIKTYEKEGAEYFVSAVPYYLSPQNQEDILRHYRFLAEHTEGKLIAYNIPPYVHCDILPETMKKILEIPEVIAVKDSTGDWSLCQKALFLNHGGILSGNEELCGAAMAFGAEGSVPCLANAYPEFYSKMYRYAQEKNIEKVIECQKAIIKMKRVLDFSRNWISSVKYLCARKGLIQPYTSYGISPLNKAEIEKTEQYLKENEKLFIGK